MKSLLRYALIIIVSVFILAEVALRIIGRYKTYSEITRNEYDIGYGKVSNTWYYTHAPNEDRVPVNSDFSYQVKTNSLGLREKEISTTKDTSKIRLLTLGDSFVEGVGAPYDSTWPRITEKLLNAAGKPTEVINAGVGGSDVVFEYVLYRDKLSGFKPDVVVLSMNASDYTDYIYRGGMERFHEDGTTHNKSAPWYEPLFRYSHFFRGVLRNLKGYYNTGMFVADSDYPQIYAEANKLYADKLVELNNMLKAKGATLLVVVHCTPSEIRTPESINKWNMEQLDLLSKTLNEKGVQSISIIAPLRKRFEKDESSTYSHLNDMHFNTKGYYYMAALITDSIKSKGLVK